MTGQFSEKLNQNKILPYIQIGFRSGYSCITALLHITDLIIRAIDDGKFTVLVLLLILARFYIVWFKHGVSLFAKILLITKVTKY